MIMNLAMITIALASVFIAMHIVDLAIRVKQLEKRNYAGKERGRRDVDKART